LNVKFTKQPAVDYPEEMAVCNWDISTITFIENIQDLKGFKSSFYEEKRYSVVLILQNVIEMSFLNSSLIDYCLKT
jgi:hypothetical protein